MTAIRRGSYPKSDMSNVSRLRLWLSYCWSDQDDSSAREVWGKTSSSYMNYSSLWKNWPNPWTRRNEHFWKTELFVR
jgi:hypothetical protein